MFGTLLQTAGLQTARPQCVEQLHPALHRPTVEGKGQHRDEGGSGVRGGTEVSQVRVRDPPPPPRVFVQK